MLLEPIHMILNHILNTQKFPCIWAEGIIVPVFKKGDKSDPANYSGITLVRCLGKLFTDILNERFKKAGLRRTMLLQMRNSVLKLTIARLMKFLFYSR